MDITTISPIVNLIFSASSCIGFYVAQNNKLIKAEAKINELESRFNRKDKYDDELKKKVDDIQHLLTEVATLVKQIKV